MSRSFRSTKDPSIEWWSRRPLSGSSSPGTSHRAGVVKWWKRCLHKRERREWKKQDRG